MLILTLEGSPGTGEALPYLPPQGPSPRRGVEQDTNEPLDQKAGRGNKVSPQTLLDQLTRSKIAQGKWQERKVPISPLIKKRGEWSGEHFVDKDSSTKLFQADHFQRLLKKVVKSLNYPAETGKQQKSMPAHTLDARGFKRLPKDLTVCPFPEFFDSELKADWAKPGAPPSKNSTLCQKMLWKI